MKELSTAVSATLDTRLQLLGTKATSHIEKNTTFITAILTLIISFAIHTAHYNRGWGMRFKYPGK